MDLLRLVIYLAVVALLFCCPLGFALMGQGWGIAMSFLGFFLLPLCFSAGSLIAFLAHRRR